MSDIVVIGSCVVDLAFYSDKLPRIGETVSSNFRQGLGGKGFNQAVAARLSGSSVSFIGQVGNDLFGKSFINRLQELKIKDIVYTDPINPTGTAAILVSENTNIISVALGSNLLLTSKQVKENKTLIQNSKILLVQLETNLEVIEQALKIAKKNDILTILNPAPASGPLPNEILKLVDILTPNETELSNLTGVSVDPSNPSSIWGAFDKLKNQGANIVISTLGEKGCAIDREYYLDDDAIWVDAYKVNAIDTVGAGDCFNGCFASGMLRYNKDISKSVKFATAACSISVQRLGTSESMPTTDEIKEVLGES